MRNSTFNQSRFSRLIFFIAFLFLISYSASAQFYTKHYIAPAPWQYFSKSNEIVIATNSDTPVTITVARSNGTVETTLSAVKGNPAIYRFSLLAKNLPMYALNTVINGAGLIVTSTGPTSVNMRNVASDDKSGDNNDAYLKGNAALTSFGDAGLGIRFRVGYYRDGSLGNFNSYGDQRPIYSIMATVDNTTIKISNAVITTLNAGQSYLFKAPIGTLVESSSPAVMNTSAAIDTPDGCGDSAYNQIPPESVLGTEYFIERGKGNNTAEKTTIVATKDNTNLVIDTYSPSGALTATTNYTLATAGSFYTFNNGSLDTPFSASRVSANNKIVVYSGTAQSCEVDISTIAPVSECGGSNFIETAKFRDYGTGSLPYFGYILLRSKTDEVKVNGTNIETITGIAARHQLGTTGWYLINFEDTQINSPNVLSISSASKMTVSIVQQGGGFSMAGFFSNFAAQPEDPTLTYIAGGGCTNNTAALTTLPNFAPYQWYYNGTAISGATSSTYTATKTGNYTVSWTLACGAQTQSKPISVTLCTDLGITKTVDNAKPCVGSNVEFTVKVSNLGGNNVSGVSVNDLLPSGYTFVSATPSVGNYDSATGIWSIGDVDAQTSVTLKITATVKSSGNYTNTASLPASIDTNTANNSASAAVNPNPVVTLVTNPITVCSPATGDLTAAAVTTGSSSNLTFSYYTNAAATAVYSNPTSAAAGTYYIKAVSAEGCSVVKSVVVTINPKPTIPVIYVSADKAACGNSGSIILRSVDDANTYGGSTYLWSTGATTRSITINADGVYSLKIVSSAGCTSDSSLPITVTVKPAVPTASDQSFCASENKTVNDLVATGTSLKWYDAATNGTQYAVNTPLTARTYYVSQTGANGCESDRKSVKVTISSSSAPVASAQTYCAAENKTVGNLIATGSSLKWYTALTNGTQYTGSEPLVSGNYYVSQTANSCGESARTLVPVTVNDIPSAPTASSQVFCATDGKIVSNLIATGSNLKWYSASSGGTLYDGTETLSTKNYYVSQSNSCGESPRTTVAVTVNTTAAPTAPAQSFCLPDAKKVNNLVVTTGTNLKWYNASAGGTAYGGTETLATGTYYVTQTLNNCESPRTAVSVTVFNTPAPTADSQIFCAGDAKKVNDLVVTSGTNLKWYSASSGGTAFNGTEILSSANYYVSQTLNNCESSRILVSVTVNPTPATPSISAGSSTTLCAGGNVVLTSTSGIGYLWSNGATTQSITVSTPGSYGVQVTNASGCLSAPSTPVNVTVNTIPSTPTVNVTNNCNGTSTLTTSATGTLLWSTGETTSSITVSTAGTYSVTQTVNGCTSVAGSGTAAPKTTPSTPTVNVTNNCNGTSTLTTSASGTLLWSTGETTSSITVSTAGTYSVTQTVNGCTSAAGSGTAAPKTTPSTPTVNVTNNCNGTSTLTTSAAGTLLWSTGKTTSSITVSTAGTYSVTQTVNGCTSAAGSGTAAPKTTPSTPTVNVTNNCDGTSTLTTSATGTLLWSTGETTSSITVSTAGTYSVTQTVNGCTSAAGSGTAAPKTAPSTPTVNVTNNCNGTSTLTTSATGTLLWSTGETTSSITVSTAGTYSVTQTVNGCTSVAGSGTAAPKTAPSTPTVNVTNNCNGTSTLTTSAAGTLLWSTGETTSSITVSTVGTYSVTQTVNGCTSVAGSGTAAPKTTPSTPTVNVTNNCDGTSTLTTSAAGTLLWSTGETTSSITVSTAGTYTVTQTVNGCTSAAGSGTAAPKTAPLAPIASSQTFCFADAKTVNDLIATGNDLKWYNASANGTLYSGTDILVTGSYYVSQTLDNCESPRTLVNVTVNSKPSKVVTTATICSGDTYNWSVNSTSYTTAGTYTISNSGCTADQELQLTVLNVSSPIVGLITQPSCTSSTASVVLSGLPAGTWTINPGNISGNTASTTITGLVAGNTYNYTVTDDQGCKSTASSDVKIVNYICAQDDFPAVINGAAGGAISTVFVNDKINGSSFLPADVTVSTSTLPTGIVFNADGTITVAPNTLAGTYSITYTICMSADSSVCDSATVKIVIERPVIDAVTETTTAINSNTGGTTISLTANDTLNGTPVTVGTGAGQVDFTLISTLPAGLTLNADKTITVAAGTASGNYEVEYTICDNDHALNCDTVKSYIQVVGDVLVANADNPASVTASNQPQTIISVVDNDTRNGQPLTASEVKITTTVPDASGYLTLDPATGIATLGANAPAGTYTLTYSICDKTNASNCSTASVSLTVNAPIVIPVIDAVTETTTAINSNTGGTTISLIANDTLDGTPVTVGTGAGQVDFTLITTLPAGLTLNADKTITVAPGTASGNYEVEYTICDNDHALNCDTVKSYIQVVGDLLVLKDDTAGPIAGVNHAVTVINVLGNDTKNGLPIVASDVNVSETIADPSGYLTLNPDGTIVLKENAPAGTYGLTYQVCELNTTNCATATVKVTVVLPTMTVTANSYCSNDVPYVSYDVKADNFTPNNLLTVKWIDSDNNVVATQTNLPLSGSILWPGAVVDNNGIGIDWPGWLLTNGQWIEGADGFEKTRTGVTVQFSLNPTVSISLSYPPATPQCNARPTFVIKANNDTAGPIDAKKSISTALNIFSNDRLNGIAVNETAVVLSTVVANPNLVLNADGSVDVKTGTPSGTYQLTYQICEASNSSNCSQAVVNVTVVNSVDPAPPAPTQLVTKDDLQINVDGINGQLEFINVLSNDLLNGLPIDPADIVISNTPKSPYFEFNADGTVNVKPNTPAGNYALVYQVCEKANTSNCSSATLNVFVEIPNIAIVKTAVFNDENGNGFANAGETITYKFKITNTGNVPLTRVTVADPLPGAIVSGQAIDLEVGEVDDHTFTAQYKITQSDIIRGTVTNQATARGFSARGVDVDDKSDDASNAGDNPTVINLNGCQIKVLNAFSPNGDSKNSRFYIQGIECYPDNTVEIYNRWGVLVFDIDHYNNEDRVFVGVSAGRATIKELDGLPVGTYFYILKYKDNDSNQHEQSGYLYLNK